MKCLIKFLLCLCVLFSLWGCGSHSSASKNTKKKNPPATFGVMWQSAQHNENCEWLGFAAGLDRAVLYFVYKSYGDHRKCISDFANLPIPKRVIRGAGSQGVCERKGNCSDREATTDFEIIKNGIEFVELALSVCVDCKIELVLQLEDNFSPGHACFLAGKIRDGLNLMGVFDVEIWRNPVAASQIGNSYDCFDGIELHHDAASEASFKPAKRCAYSNDGHDLQIGGAVWSLPHRISRAAILEQAKRFPSCDFYLWNSNGNCLQGDSANAPFPYQRNCVVDGTVILEMNSLLKELSK